MMKSPTSEKNGLKKGPWTPEEDQKLIDYIQKHGHGKWRTLPKNAGLKRCGKSCRLRWTNYLRPDIKRGRFSFEEEEIIIQLHSVLGNKWSAIAAYLPGRTDNEIKNYWNTHIKKRLLKMGIDPVTHTPCLDVLQLSSILNSSFYNSSQLNYPGLFGIGSAVNSSQLLNLLTFLLPYQSRNPDVMNKNFQQSQSSQCSQSVQLNSIQAFQPNQSQVPIQEYHQSCSPSNPLHIEHSQLMKTNLNHQISSNVIPFSHQNTLPNFWQYNNGGCQSSDQQQSTSSAIQSFSSSKFNSKMVNNLLENEILHNKEGMPNFNLGSLLSSNTCTPSSTSSSTLNSSSSTAFVNGSTEGEMDTYCSNMLMYNISNGLNDSRLF